MIKRIIIVSFFIAIILIRRGIVLLNSFVSGQKMIQGSIFLRSETDYVH